MTLLEANEIIGILQFNYPDTFTNLSDEAMKTYVRNWHSFFKEDSYEIVVSAVRAYIATSTERFLPNVGQIREQIYKLTEPRGMSENEAWALVATALKNGLYGYQEEYKKLPPTIQRALGSATTIREWAEMDTETLNSVVASNFMRSYRAIAQREAEWSKLPPGFREEMHEISNRIFGRLESGGGECGLPRPPASQ